MSLRSFTLHDLIHRNAELHGIQRYTLMEIRHLGINQHGETIADFPEAPTFLPRAAGTA